MPWVNRTVAVVLTLISVLVVVFPPPSLPLRFLPVVAVVVLAVMLIWQQGRTTPIPTSHIDDMRRVAQQVMADIDALQRPRFDLDVQRDQLLGQAFKSHFPRASADLEKFEALLKTDGQAQAHLTGKVLTETGVLAQQHNLQVETVRTILSRTAEGQMSASSPPISDPGPLTIQSTPFGITLFLGASGIAVSGSSSAQEDMTAARKAFIDSTHSVANWPETQTARTARIALTSAKESLRRQLIEITHRHGLSGRCRLCAQP